MPDPNKLQGKTSREILFDLYHTKQTPMSEIATLFGVNTETIRYHMKRMDIPRRPAGGQKGQLNAAWRGGQKKQRGKLWSYERIEKAHQRAKERWEANNFRQKEREWTQEERDHMRQVAKYRKRLNGKFAS